MLNGAAWQHLIWRQGIKGPLSGRFTAVCLRLADGQENAWGQHLSGQAAWIIGEQRRRKERKYHVCNLPASTPRSRLVEVARRRWAVRGAGLSVYALDYADTPALSRPGGFP